MLYMEEQTMPPKQKVSREDIQQAAFQLTREQGMEVLNARNLAQYMHCSTQPIFSYYKNMADLKTDVFNMANIYHSNYFNKTALDENFFLNIGLVYIDFALEEPNLFRLLFMSGGFSGKKLNEFVTEDCNEYVAGGIPKTIDRNSDSANKMFTDMWLYAHGIASMLVTNQLRIERDEIEAMVRNMFCLLTGEKPEGEN